jgi:hypothetical protein
MRPTGTGSPEASAGTQAAPLPEPLAGEEQLAELMLRFAAAGVTVARRDIATPAHIDFTTCQDGYFDSWIGTGDHGRFQQGPGQRDSLWILDVDGYRLVIDGEHMPGATQAQIKEITGMVKTLTFRTAS